MDPALSSSNSVHFLLRALLEGQRTDGRFFLEYRKVAFALDRSDGRASAEVRLGTTRVFAEVTAHVAAPSPEKPLDGYLAFQVDFAPMAYGGNGGVSGGGADDMAKIAAGTITRVLEKQIRDARAIDTEALCIVPAKAVWAIRVDVCILDDGGNSADAASLATMAALLHFRRADVTVRGGDAIIHSYTERAPVPLAIHHIPITVSFALFSPAAFHTFISAVSGGMIPGVMLPASFLSTNANTTTTTKDVVIVLDPSLNETIAADGTVSIVMNAHAELCGVQKIGGCPVSVKALASAAKAAGEAATALIGAMKLALSAADVAAAEKAMIQHAASSGYVKPTTTTTTTVASNVKSSSNSGSSTTDEKNSQNQSVTIASASSGAAYLRKALGVNASSLLENVSASAMEGDEEEESEDNKDETDLIGDKTATKVARTNGERKATTSLAGLLDTTVRGLITANGASGSGAGAWEE